MTDKRTFMKMVYRSTYPTQRVQEASEKGMTCRAAATKKSLWILSAVVAYVVIFICMGMLTTAHAAVKKPAKVKNVSVTSQSCSRVKIIWGKAQNAQKYKIAYKKKSASKWKIKTTKKKTCTIKKLARNTTYMVKVRGINGNKKGKWSKMATVKTKKSYSYSISNVNTYTTFYTGEAVLFYIKTGDPELDYDNISTNCSFLIQKYDDVNYLDYPIVSAVARVSGGYLVTVTGETAGKKTIKVRVDGKTVAKKSFVVYDYSVGEDAWLDKIIAQETDDSMTDVKKMRALWAYVKGNFKYIANGDDGILCLTTEQGAYFQTYAIQCWTATDIMRAFADKLGLKNEATYAGYQAHYYATVYIDGKARIYDACPLSSTGYIDSVEYVF